MDKIPKYAHSITIYSPERARLTNGSDDRGVRVHHRWAAALRNGFAWLGLCSVVVRVQDQHNNDFYINKKSLVKWINNQTKKQTADYHDTTQTLIDKIQLHILQQGNLPSTPPIPPSTTPYPEGSISKELEYQKNTDFKSDGYDVFRLLYKAKGETFDEEALTKLKNTAQTNLLDTIKRTPLLAEFKGVVGYYNKEKLPNRDKCPGITKFYGTDVFVQAITDEGVEVIDPSREKHVILSKEKFLKGLTIRADNRYSFTH